MKKLAAYLFSTICVSFATGSAGAGVIAEAPTPLKAQLLSAMNDCAVKPEAMKFYDLRKGWKAGALTETKYFKTIRAVPMVDVNKYGLDPSRREEVNFWDDGKALRSFAFKNPLVKKACQFSFTFLATGRDDKELKPFSLVDTWQDKVGKGVWLYVFELPARTEYINSGSLGSGEVAFPMPLAKRDLVAAYEIVGTKRPYQLKQIYSRPLTTKTQTPKPVTVETKPVTVEKKPVTVEKEEPVTVEKPKTVTRSRSKKAPVKK